MENDQHVSVKDHDAFTQRHLRDMGQEIEEFEAFTWRLTKWKSLQRRITSNKFTCGGHSWRILLFPLGNVTGPPYESVAVYFEHIIAEDASSDWHVCAQFALVISNPNDPTIYVQANVHHRFTADEADWGFTQFSKLRNLYAIQDGRTRPIIEDEAADITVYARVMKDPTGVLWHDFKNYDSKKQTGFIGLKEEANNNYICAVLQSFFGICAFRQAIYQIPPQDNAGPRHVVSALQHIFYDMQTSATVVKTNKLTNMSGWKDMEKDVSEDAVHFARALRHKLEQQTQGTSSEGVVAKLFLGKMRCFIKAIHVDFESSHVEDFDALHLNVDGIKNLHDSFVDYVSAETLDGDQKYDTGALGLQAARKSTILQSLPPILEIDLKRYRYSALQQTQVKNNDRFEFPLEIDLAEFLDKTADKSQSWVYDLYGIIVHSGELSGGHYFCFLKPLHSVWWLKFDQDRVIPVVDREVLHNSYGCNDIDGRPTSAYALFYLRRICKDEMLAPISESDIPKPLKPAFTVKIIDADTLRRNDGFDLSSSRSEGWVTLSALETDSFQTFKAAVARKVGRSITQFKLWLLAGQGDWATRPASLVSPQMETYTMKRIREEVTKTKSDLRLYLEVVPPELEVKRKPSLPLRLLRWGPQVPSDGSNTALIFLKHEHLLVDQRYVSIDSSPHDLRDTINQKMGWRRSTRLQFNQEDTPGHLRSIRSKTSFRHNLFQTGTVISFTRQ